MRDHNSIVCGNSATALGKIGAVSEDVVPALIKEVSNAKSQCRSEAAMALGKIGRPAEAAVPVLAKEIEKEDNPSIWRGFAGGLGGIEIGTKSVVDALAQAIEHKSDDEGFARVEATTALGKIAKNYPDAVPMLKRLQSHENALVRLQAASALVSLGKADEATLDTLIKLLDYQSKSSTDWDSTAQALGSMGKAAEPAIPALIANSRKEEIYFRFGAIKALGNIGVANEEVIRRLTEALQERDDTVRFYAAQALVQLDQVDEQVLAELTWHLRNSYHSAEAAKTLADCGPKAKSAIPNLVAALKSATTLKFRELIVHSIAKIKAEK
jgi:HEAT repeat protein